MVLYAYMCCVYVFLLHQESSDMIFGDKSLISDVVLSQLVIKANSGLNTHESI
jgi:hypothetical protein